MFINHCNWKITTEKMESKLLSLFIVLALSLALVSASDLSLSQPGDLSKAINSSSFTITNNNATQSYNITIRTPITINDDTGKSITILASQSSFLLSNLSSKTITLAYSTVPSGFALGTFSTSILAYNTQDVSNNVTIGLNFVDSYCSNGDNGTLSITKLTDEKLDNKNSWEWHPLDNIKVTVKVHNGFSEDLDVILEYGLYNPGTHDFIDLNQDTIDLSVDRGSSKETTLSFQVPSDTDERSDYRFYVKAYEDGREKGNCVDIKDSYYQTVELIKESKNVVLDAIKTDSSYTCGDTVELKMDVANIGKSDEDKVLVIAFNKELGLNQNKLIDSLDSGDSQSITFTFKIPANATSKTYNIDLKSYFKYDDGNSGCSNDQDLECYDKNSLDDMDRSFLASFKVEGCAPQITRNAQIVASLQTADSDVKAGKQVVIKATVTNTGSDSTVYVLDVLGEESFSTVESINPATLTLNAGESKDVLITLNLNKGSEGSHIFTIKTLFGTQEVSKQVSLSVASSGISLPNIFSGSNWFIWLIVAINVILIIAIIIVAVKLSRS